VIKFNVNESDYFLKHWKILKNSNISKVKVKEANRFFSNIQHHLTLFNKFSFLDIGCGDGVHLKVISDKYNVDKIAGIDISEAAISRAKKLLHNKSIDYYICDALSIPDEVPKFDVIISYGVLAYTGNWREGILQMKKKLNKDGLFGFWMMARPNGIKGVLFIKARSIFSKLPNFMKFILSLLLVPFLYFLPLRSGINIMNSSLRECLEIIKVNLYPKILEFPTKKEIESFLISQNIEILYTDEEVEHTYWCKC